MLFTKVIKGTSPVDLETAMYPVLHLSGAVLKVSDNTPNKRVYLYVEDKSDAESKAAIWIFQKDKIEAASLDYFLDTENSDYRFSLSENAEVHLTGYWDTNSADDDLMDEEMMDEKAGGLAAFQKNAAAAAGSVPALVAETVSAKPDISVAKVSKEAEDEDDEDDDDENDDDDDEDEDDENDDEEENDDDDEEEMKPKPQAIKPVQQQKGKAQSSSSGKEMFEDKKRARPDTPFPSDSAQKKMKQENGSPMNKQQNNNNNNKFNKNNNQHGGNKFGGNKNNNNNNGGNKFGGNNQNKGFDKNKKQGGKPFQKGAFGKRTH